MNTELRYLLSMSCLLPAVVGLLLYRKMQPKYHLIVYMMLMDAVTETITFAGIKYTSFTQIADCWNNAYIIISLVLFLVFVKRSGYIKKPLLQSLIAAAVIIAGYNFFETGPPFEKFYLSLLVYMFGVKLFIAIDILSKQVTVVNVRLVRNFWFWAGCLFVVQNAYGFLVFGLYSLSLFTIPDGKNIGILTLCVNIFFYCLFAVVLLLVPKRNSHSIHKIS